MNKSWRCTKAIRMNVSRIALLTVLVTSGSMVQGLTPATAQPGVTRTPGTLKIPPLGAAERGAINRILDWNKQEDLCALPIHLRVTDGTLQDLASRVQAALPRRVPIEVRANSTTRFTLDVPNTPVGEILKSAADLTDCNFYVLSDRLLLASKEQINQEELHEVKEWGNGINANPHWSNTFQGQQLFADTIATTLTQYAAVGGVNNGQVALGEMSPELQQMVQQLVNMQGREMGGDGIHRPPPLPQLLPNTLVSFSAEPGKSSLGVEAHSPQHYKFTWKSSHEANGSTFSSSASY